ncbi:MAG: hypothetical protein ACREO4_04085 [Lysobacter sp.]
MRGFAWALAALVGLPILVYLALVLVNWNDEPPSASAQRLVAMNRDRPELADAANGYFAMQSLAVAPGADPDYMDARSAEVAALATACGEALACAKALDAHPGALTKWLESEQWLLERYRRMLASEGWREPIPDNLNLPLPAYQHAMEAQKLHLLDARQLALAGDPVGVRDLLERDMVFWRQVLASSDLLISKMIAVAAVSRNFALGNLALRELPQDLADTALPPSWRTPLTVAERSLARTLGGEWHFAASALRTALSPDGPGAASHQRVSDFLLRPLYQEQATVNRSADRMMRVGTLSELPYPELGPALEHLARPQKQARLPFTAYNPVGTLLDAMASASFYANYVARAADLEGQRRAALLVATLRSEGTGREDAAAAVRDAALRSPYDDAPFAWDGASGSVVFRGLDKGARGQHAVLF